MYIYENHMGGLYSANKKLSTEELHCDGCGDFDWFVCEVDADTPIEETVKMIEIRCGVNLCEWVENCNSDCQDCSLYFFSGGYCKEEVHDILTEFYSEEEINRYFEELVKKRISEGPMTEEEYEKIFG